MRWKIWALLLSMRPGQQEQDGIAPRPMREVARLQGPMPHNAQRTQRAVVESLYLFYR